MAKKVTVLIIHGIDSQKRNFTDAIIVEQVKICIKNLNQQSIESSTFPDCHNGIFPSLC